MPPSFPRPGPPALPILLALLSAARVQAQLPLTIEEMLVEEARLTATLRTALQTGQQPVLLAGPAGARVGRRDVRSESVAVGLRYGLAPRLEINAFLERRRRRSEVGALAGASEQGGTIALGASWLAYGEPGAGSLLLDLRLDALSRPLPYAAGAVPAAAAAVGVTWYRAIDPVVLSLAARYRRARSVEVAGVALAPGDEFRLDAGVNFAVNRQVTLFGGLQLGRRAADRADGRSLTATRIGQRLSLGLGYAPTPETTIFVRAALPAGAGGSTASLELLYDF